MIKTTFNKPPLSLNQQISLLKKRNLVLTNEEFAKHKLQSISYYRLSAYFRHFYIFKEEKFKDNIYFEDILKYYYFDKELRKLIFNHLEDIEIFFRTKLIEVISAKGAFAYLEDNFFHFNQDKILNKIQSEISRSKEVFVKHFKTNYSNEHLPIWMVVETLSFGTISFMYQNLNENTKIEISKKFNLPIVIFESWLHNLVYIRNICAHHSRLWNRILAIRPKKPRKITLFKELDNKKIFFTLSLMKYLLNFIDNEENLFKNEIITLLKKYPDIPKRNMGFPDNWLDLELWK